MVGRRPEDRPVRQSRLRWQDGLRDGLQRAAQGAQGWSEGPGGTERTVATSESRWNHRCADAWPAQCRERRQEPARATRQEPAGEGSEGHIQEVVQAAIELRCAPRSEPGPAARAAVATTIASA